MARVKLLLFAIIALGLAVWGFTSLAGAMGSDPEVSEAQLSASQAAAEKSIEAQGFSERATAFQVLSSADVSSALASAKSDGPALADAPALKAAIEKALQAVPGSKPIWVAAAMATPSGAVAVVPGHDPLSAGQFAWINDAIAAGAGGLLADVAGKHVRVFAAPVRAVKGDDVTELGKVAIAFSRNPADLAPLFSSDAWKGAVVVDKKTVAASSKDLGDLAPAATASATTLKAGSVDSLGPLKFPMGAADGKWPLVRGRSFTVPDYPGASFVVMADLKARAALVAAAQKTGVFAILGILVFGLVFVALGGGAAAAEPATEPEVRSPRVREEPAVAVAPSPNLSGFRAEPGPSSSPVAQASPPPAPAAPELELAPPPPPPEPALQPDPYLEPLPAENVAAVEASPPPEPEPAPAPASFAESEMVSASSLMSESAESAPQVPGFDELFGPGLEAPPSPPRHMPATDPLAFLSGAPTPVTEERTSTMSLAEVQGLAAKAAQSAPEPRHSEDATRVVPVPTAPPDPFGSMNGMGDEPIQDRTVVAMVPQELLRAATRAAPQGRPSSNPIGLAGLSAEEIHFQDVYREFCMTRERCGEPADNLTFEKFAAKLRKNKEALVQKYACKSVRFQVYVKEGKAALKATPVKEA